MTKGRKPDEALGRHYMVFDADTAAKNVVGELRELSKKGWTVDCQIEPNCLLLSRRADWWPEPEFGM